MDEITKQIEQMAEKMEKSSSEQEFSVDLVKASIEKLGPEGLKKAVVNMTDEQKTLLKEVLEDMSKSKGEGSRGGKIVGHTKSGKAIYETASHEGHAGFDKEDHMDAARLHNKRSMESSRVDEEHEPASQIDPHLEAAGHDMKAWHAKRHELSNKFGEAKKKHEGARNALTDKMSLGQLREFHGSGKAPKSAGHQKRHSEYEAASKEYDQHYKNVNDHLESHPADEHEQIQANVNSANERLKAEPKTEKDQKYKVVKDPMDDSVQTEKIKKSASDLEPTIDSTPNGDEKWNADEKLHQASQDEKVAEEAKKKKQAEMRNQGGHVIEGWEGQVIKSAEMSQEKSEEKPMSTEQKKEQAKAGLKQVMVRMQERRLEKSKCVAALAKSLQCPEDKIGQIWDALAKSDASEATKEKDQPEASQSAPAPIMKDGKEVKKREPMSGEAQQTAPMAKSKDAYWHEEEVVYTGKEEVFKSNRFGKNAHYTVDQEIVDQAAAQEGALKKSTFMYTDVRKSVSPDELAVQQQVNANSKKQAQAQKDAKEEIRDIKTNEKLSRIEGQGGPHIPMLKSSSAPAEELIRKGLDMDDMVLEQAQAIRKSKPSNGFKVKSFSDEDMDLEFNPETIWGKEEAIEKSKKAAEAKKPEILKKDVPVADEASASLPVQISGTN